jgi:hypothetical protein
MYFGIKVEEKPLLAEFIMSISTAEVYPSVYPPWIMIEVGQVTGNVERVDA